jgi:hypothetical protein
MHLVAVRQWAMEDSDFTTSLNQCWAEHQSQLKAWRMTSQYNLRLHLTKGVHCCITEESSNDEKMMPPTHVPQEYESSYIYVWSSTTPLERATGNIHVEMDALCSSEMSVDYFSVNMVKIP